MDSRVSTRTRLSVLPVFIALIFNLMAPVLSVAVPDGAPEPLQQRVSGAAPDPEHVSFTLEGCRNPSVDLEATGFICADGDYTTGNLGKTWNELDLVPHRLTATLGTQDAATTTYTMGITADHMDGGFPGYDVLTEPVINVAKSDASCQIVVGAQTVIAPGVGGTDSSLGRLLTITQDKGTTCVFDWVERLALGSHNFPGSSLHSNRTNQVWSTQGIGAADVSIPVKEILPQEIAKTMTAEQGQAYGWAIDKSADPSSLEFANTCLTGDDARSADVAITITWTRSGPMADGDTLITTNIYATNPAHRSVLVQVTDKIYAGADQSTLLDTATSGQVSVAAGAEDVLVLTHQFVYDGSATSFNDVATATYTDEDLGIVVPGNTTATASATTVAGDGPVKDASVLITDTESISGEGLSFSVAAPSIGAFTGGYVAGASTTGPVGWEYTATNSGSVTFTKTVTVDEPRITSGALTDTATITGTDGTIASDNESVAITTDALVSLEINKTIPAGSLRSGESVTFNFDIAGPGGFDGDASITFDFGDPLTKSTSLADLAPGEYTVSEQPQANWADHLAQSDTITLPDCDGSVSFNNSTLAPDLGITKEADADSVNAGDAIGFSIVVDNDGSAGTGVAKDVELNDPLPGSLALGIDWQLDAVVFNGTPVGDPGAWCEVTGSAPTQTLECDFGDLDPGDEFEVQVSSDTSAPDGCLNATLPNTAKAIASNHDEVEASASITVECPDLEISKSADAETVSAGDGIGFTVTVANNDAAGTGTAINVTLDDPLPGSTALDVDWSVEAVWLNGVEVGNPGDYCSITGDAPGQTLECEFGDLAAGESAAVHVTSETSAPDGCLNADLVNVASAEADNHEAITADATITVECPDLDVEKVASDELISVGEAVGFTITVTNSDAAGTGTAANVTLNDPLPGSTALGIDWSLESVWLNGVAVDDPNVYCEVTGDAPAQTLECAFGDLEPGDSAAVFVASGTSAVEECATANLQNTATADADNHGVITADTSIIVECPGLNIVKTADADLIDAGDEASFTITVWNAGPGTAFDVELHDTLPAGLTWDFEVLQGDADCGIASSLVLGGAEEMSIDCELGDLAASEMEDGVIIRIFADTDRSDCGPMVNTAFADASNDDEVSSTDEIDVRCTVISLDKANDAVGSVLPGTTVTYTLTLTVDDGPAEGVTVVDSLPVGLENPTSISDGGVASADGSTITWDLGDLADGEYTLTYQATVADDVANGDELVNAAAATSTNSQCPDIENLGPECEDSSTVIVRVPTLVIDKEADADVITISGEADELVADPEIVTWTLTYTLANGPVTNAVITDEIPTGFVFLDASDGGQLVDGVVTWTFATLTESGSVTFRTTVDPETISRVAPTVNVAVIDSDETEPDEGTDSVTVTVEAPPLGGNPTPKPVLPNTAAAIGINGTPVTVPVELLVAFFIGSLGALALANVKARNSRR